MQAIAVARARDLYAEEENHQWFGDRPQPGLPWDKDFTAVDVDRQLTTAVLQLKNSNSSWLVVILGLLNLMPHVEMCQH
jgi:hypothetical protein